MVMIPIGPIELVRSMEPEPVSADDYAQMLTNYINLGHEILKMQVEALRVRLERGEFR
jgi:hypothetical protein